MRNQYLPSPGHIIRLPGSMAPRPTYTVIMPEPAAEPVTCDGADNRNAPAETQPMAANPRWLWLATGALVIAGTGFAAWAGSNYFETLQPKPQIANATPMKTMDMRPERMVVYYTAPLSDDKVVENTDAKGCEWLIAMDPSKPGGMGAIHPKLDGNRQICKDDADSARPFMATVRGEDLPQVAGSGLVVVDVLDAGTMQSIGVPAYVTREGRQNVASIFGTKPEVTTTAYMTANDPRLTDAQKAEVEEAVAAEVKKRERAAKTAASRSQPRAPAYQANYPMPSYMAPSPMPAPMSAPASMPQVIPYNGFPTQPGGAGDQPTQTRQMVPSSNRPTAGRPAAGPLEPIRPNGTGLITPDRSATSITADNARSANERDADVIRPTVIPPREVRVGEIGNFTNVSQGGGPGRLPNQQANDMPSGSPVQRD